jgi:excisionase family DNA binding protein
MNDFFTTEEAARYLGISHSTLTHYRMTGISPPHIKVGPRFIRYRRSEIDQWLTENTLK